MSTANGEKAVAPATESAPGQRLGVQGMSVVPPCLFPLKWILGQPLNRICLHQTSLTLSKRNNCRSGGS